MLAANHKEFIDLFKELEDPRVDGKLSYPLDEVFFLVLAAILSGAESWRKIIRYGDNKLEFLRNFFPFEMGIPSKTTIIRLFSIMEKEKLESWLSLWANGLAGELQEELIAIDGKALCGARKHDKEKSALYLLNAFATTHGLVIGQQTVGEKSNEITAIPELLNKLSIAGNIISIDAMGCQKKVAAIILEKKANYFFALKANQSNLFDDVKSYFSNVKLKSDEHIGFYDTFDKGHGREEFRRCWSSNNVDWLRRRHADWSGITSICMIESERWVKQEKSIERRYYISSCESDAQKLLSYSRKHWGIENNLHWILDVQFNEDKSHVRQKNAAENMGAIRKIVINLIKKYKKKFGDKEGISTIRLAAGWDDKTAQKILWGLV